MSSSPTHSAALHNSAADTANMANPAGEAHVNTVAVSTEVTELPHTSLQDDVEAMRALIKKAHANKTAAGEENDQVASEDEDTTKTKGAETDSLSPTRLEASAAVDNAGEENGQVASEDEDATKTKGAETDSLSPTRLAASAAVDNDTPAEGCREVASKDEDATKTKGAEISSPSPTRLTASIDMDNGTTTQDVGTKAVLDSRKNTDPNKADPPNPAADRENIPSILPKESNNSTVSNNDDTNEPGDIASRSNTLQAGIGSDTGLPVGTASITAASATDRSTLWRLAAEAPVIQALGIPAPVPELSAAQLAQRNREIVKHNQAIDDMADLNYQSVVAAYHGPIDPALSEILKTVMATNFHDPLVEGKVRLIVDVNAMNMKLDQDNEDLETKIVLATEGTAVISGAWNSLKAPESKLTATHNSFSPSRKRTAGIAGMDRGISRPKKKAVLQKEYANKMHDLVKSKDDFDRRVANMSKMNERIVAMCKEDGDTEDEATVAQPGPATAALGSDRVNPA